MKRIDKIRCNRIVAAIEKRNETVIHEGLLCFALDVKGGVLLWHKPTGWLGLKEDITTYSAIQGKYINNHRNVPIYKEKAGTVHLLTPELKQLLKEIEV